MIDVLEGQYHDVIDARASEPGRIDQPAAGRYTSGMSNHDHAEKQFNVRLSVEERAILDVERERLGLRHTGDVIRLWIAAVRERRRAIERETDASRITDREASRDRTTQREVVTA